MPVTTQEEIRAAEKAGQKWQLLSHGLAMLVRSAIGAVIPSLGTPKQRLTAWREKHAHALGGDMIRELDDILEDMP